MIAALIECIGCINSISPSVGVDVDQMICIYENMVKGIECGKYSKTDFKK